MQHVLEIVQRTEMLVCPFLALVFMVLLAFKSWQVTLWERNSCFASHAQNIFWLARPIVSTHVLNHTHLSPKPWNTRDVLRMREVQRRRKQDEKEGY
jgi:hypothetical protein